MKKFLLSIVILLALCSVSFAAVAIQGNGTPLGVATTLNFIDGPMSGSFDGSTLSFGNVVELETGNVSLGTGSSGTTFVVQATAGNPVFRLPSAITQDGMVFTFIDGKTSATSLTWSVKPYIGETIKYSIASVVLDANDKITSTGQTGDSVTLISCDTGEWCVKDMHGAFTDGGL